MKKIFTLFVTALLIYACGGSNNQKNTGSQSSRQPAAEDKAITIPADIEAKLTQYNCLMCHRADEKIIGPPYKEVAQRNYKPQEIVSLIHNPKPENWPGYTPMPPQPEVPQEDALAIANWINSLK